MSEIVLRPLLPGDLETAAELSQEQGWPHRIEDWRMLLALGEGFAAEQDGRLVGTIMAWRFGPQTATLGMVIVTNAMQGKGLGKRLMQTMLQRLDGCTVMLNATEAGLPLYLRCGFTSIGKVFQHQAPAPPMPLAPLQAGERIRPLGKDAAQLGRLYDAASGMDRSALLQRLLRHGQAVVLDRAHEPVGFAILRRFGRGWSIGPIIAPDIAGAKALASHWLAAMPNRFCRLDVSEESGMSPWLEALGLPQVGTVETMARGPLPATSGMARSFALVSQALG